jgi:hypothetical protein
MTINFGKRYAGSLIATDPGDTLYIPFATYNDSGASIVDTGLNQADIEIYKNNGVTARATDSGVWLGDSGVNYYVGGTRVAAGALSDTGLYGDVKGLYSIGLRLFNTSDDTGFFDAGSSYAVTVQGLSIKTGQGHAEVNFIPAVFEIDGVRNASKEAGNRGTQQADIVSVLGDTGAAHLDQGKFGVLSDSGVAAAVLDTGKVAAAVWTNHATRQIIDTGLDDTGVVVNAVWNALRASHTTAASFGRMLTDSGMVATVVDTGKVSNAVWDSTRANHTGAGTMGKDITDSGMIAAVLDTGKVAAAVWTNHAARTVLDTGIAQLVWKESTSTYTGDTGSLGYAQGRLMAAHGDTGAVHLVSGRLAATDSGIAATVLDTGKVSNAVWNTLRADHTVAASFGKTLTDSGMVATVVDTGKVAAAVWTNHAARTVLDTGIAQIVWKESPSTYTADTGSMGYAQGRLMAVKSDTGAAHLTGGRLGVSASATVDTGVIVNAVWDSLRADHVTAATFGKTLADSGMVAAVIDTGKAAAAIWTNHATRDLSTLTYTVGGMVDANIQYVNAVAVGGTGDTGLADTWGPA